MEPRLADGFYPLAERFLEGEEVTWFNKPKDKTSFMANFAIEASSGFKLKAEQANTSDNTYSNAPAGSIAIIPVQGTIMKDDNCGDPGTDTMSQWVRDAMASPNIIGIMQHVNSGGGTVEGTAEYEELIEQASAMMPVETFTDGMCCSAAYWISAPTRITASSGTVEIGSIGTAGSWKDYSPSMAGRVNSHYVTADESFDKNAAVQQVFKGNYQPVKDAIINPTQAIFKQSVIDNRQNLQLTDVTNENGDVIGQTPLTGQTYLAQTAIDLGLIDAIGNMDSVLQSIRDRAASDEFSSKNQTNDMSIFGKKTNFKKLGALKGKKAADITEGEIVAVNEELEAEGLDNVAIISVAQLEEANTFADTIEGGLTALNAALNGSKHTTLDDAITALVADRDKHAKDAKEFGNQPGERASKARTTATAEGGDPGAKKYSEMNDLEKKSYKKSQLAAKKQKLNFNMEDAE